MTKMVLDAAELVKQYRGDRGIVEGEPCQKCIGRGVLNPIYYYRDITKKKGRCYSCFHIEGDKPTKQPTEFMELENGDRVYEGKRCSNCKTKLRIFDEETGHRLGLRGKAKMGTCYCCARMKAEAAKPIAEHRDFMDDVRKAVWKFYLYSVQVGGYVEVIARDPFERSQMLQLKATAMMMNRHAELAGLSVRYDLDHEFPASGEGDTRGMTNVANVRIILASENRSKRDQIPANYEPGQVINVADFQKIVSYHEASKALKRWFEEGEKASDYTPERQAAYTKKQAALKAEVEAIEERVSVEFCQAVYAAVDATSTSLFDVLTVVQSKLKRFQIGGNQKLVETYQRRLKLHGSRGFVTVDRPDLEAMAYAGKGAVLWAVEATVSNVLDGITILMEQGVTPEQQRMIDAISYDCIGWALSSIDSKGEVFPFISPLLGVFGDKIFSVRERYGKHCLTVFANNAKGRLEKMLSDAELTTFDGDPVGPVLVSASDDNVLDRLAEFDNQTLALQRQKQAAENTKAEAIQALKDKTLNLIGSIGEAVEGVRLDWAKLVERAGNDLLSGEESEDDRSAVIDFFSHKWKPQFDEAEQRLGAYLELCRGYLQTPFAEPAEAKAALSELERQRPVVTLPDPFQREHVRTLDEQIRLREVLERMEREDAEKAEKRKAEQQARQEKAAFLKSPAGQAWLARQKARPQSRAGRWA